MSVARFLKKLLYSALTKFLPKKSLPKRKLQADDINLITPKYNKHKESRSKRISA